MRVSLECMGIHIGLCTEPCYRLVELRQEDIDKEVVQE